MSTLTQARFQDTLVPGRTCGECQACCVVTAIDKPDIQKMANSPCAHSLCGGCGIYEARPAVCRDYYCGWRRMDLFPADWRPDKVGLFFELLSDQPAPFQPMGVSMILIGNPLKTIRRPDVVDFIARNIRNKIAMFMGLPGPKGKQAATLQLNTKEMFDAAGHSRGEVKEVLEKMLKRLAAHSFIPYVMENSGHDVST